MQKVKKHFYLFQAQGLRGPITSGTRLMHSDHELYLMKCADDNKLVLVYTVEAHYNKPLITNSL